MIYAGIGAVIMAVGVLWLIAPAKRPNRVYGYLSYLAKVNPTSFAKAQRWASLYLLLSGLAALILGILIHSLHWDRFFIIWLLTGWLFIILPIAATEDKLYKFLRDRHELPADYVKPDEVKHKRVKGFKD
ncbi:MAG: SdpI family protein [Lactobacillus sp.]|jgi:uncharacterized membrane protein|nr:SdpI family protein [Lactobacillus sp.]MCH3906535.1 SdpI family protein [Lactobacillus sp.]MCH3989830.1 SdpI family protein [Lactobacillus sp.]MCH4068004.1 SdpI family protein [Lactobacillus sp.]MCI1304040.1 SdpI family protein [Lactobacillus sp.]